jgi:predicted nucleic acid-binding protein
MTSGVAEPIFVDTNILVYASLSQSPFHVAARDKLQTLRAAGANLWISRQVLREYLAVVTRPQVFAHPLSPADAANDIRLFEQQFHVADDDGQVTVQLLALLAVVPSQGKQIHDANLVATMLVHGIPFLLTHNVVDFVRFTHLLKIIHLVDSGKG